MRRAPIVAATLALVSAIAMGGNRPVVVGAVYPTGGPQGTGGTEEFRGVELAAEYVNGQGGLDGRLIRLRLAPANSWDAAPGAVERLAQSGITVVVGSYGSTISRPAADAASRLGVVFWETGAVGELSMEAAVGQRVFRFSPTGAAIGQTAVAFVRDRLAPRLGRGRSLRYAVAYVDDVYGRAVGRGAVAEIGKSGLPFAGVFPYTLSRVNYEDLAHQILRARADVLVAASYLADAVALRRATVRAGVPLAVKIGCSSYCMEQFGRILDEDAVGVFATDKPDGNMLEPDRLSPEAARALRWARAEHRRRYGASLSAPGLSGFAGGLALFRHVLPAAGDLSPQKVARAALGVRLPTGALPDGSGLVFAPPGHPEAGANLRASIVTCQWIRPNTRVIVWPPVYATHPIAFP